MVRFKRLILIRGMVAIFFAAMLSLTFQPVLASLSMTSMQCADAHNSAMAEAPIMAGHEHNANQPSCCSSHDAYDHHECGNLCATSCSTSIAVDVPSATESIAGLAHPQYEINYMQASLQEKIAFIPPPPRI